MDGWTDGLVVFFFFLFCVLFYFLLILLLPMWPSLLNVVFVVGVALAVMFVVENPQSMQFPTLDHGRISD